MLDNKFTPTWQRTVESTGFQAIMFIHRASSRTLKSAVSETIENEQRKRAENSISHPGIEPIAKRD